MEFPYFIRKQVSEHRTEVCLSWQLWDSPQLECTTIWKRRLKQIVWESQELPIMSRLRRYQDINSKKAWLCGLKRLAQTWTHIREAERQLTVMTVGAVSWETLWAERAENCHTRSNILCACTLKIRVDTGTGVWNVSVNEGCSHTEGAGRGQGTNLWLTSALRQCIRK